jgi:hypothetical protein
VNLPKALKHVKSAKLWAFGLLTVVAAYGCTASDAGDDSANPAATEDELIFVKGSVDHAAIVEVTTMMLVGQNPVEFATVLDPYNQEDPFKIRGTQFAGAFARNLAKFDAYDGTTDWKPAQSATWGSRVAAGNYMIIDTSKPCDFYHPHTYLEIERAQMTGREYATCGGRMPNEDALDVTLNFLIRGPAASAQDENAIRDGVDQATKQASDTFPYLAEMNGF